MPRRQRPHDREGVSHERPPRRQHAQPSDLVDVAHLVTAYYTQVPDPDDVDQQVAFGTSGHRGSSLRTAFNETHILATTQAICDYRKGAGLRRAAVHRPRHPRPVRAGLGVGARGARRPTTSPCWSTTATATPPPRGLARDPARQPAARRRTARASPTASWSRPSHNPPADGGFKYNPPHGGPADTDATSVIAGPRQRPHRGRPRRRAPDPVRPGAGRARGPTTSWAPTSTTCPHVVDLDAIREAGVRIGADPLGGASVAYWGEIAERHGLDLTVVNPLVDPTWRFMTLDWDGKIRMDCSSPSAMASLIEPQGRLRHRHRQRRRRRPARHRHPGRRADEPQPLPRRRDPVPLRRRPPRLAGAARDRQDAGVLAR